MGHPLREEPNGVTARVHRSATASLFGARGPTHFTAIPSASTTASNSAPLSSNTPAGPGAWALQDGSRSRRAVNSYVPCELLHNPVDRLESRAVSGASRLEPDRDANRSRPDKSLTGGYATSLCRITTSQKDIVALLREARAHSGKDFEERHVRGAERGGANKTATGVTTRR
jgi:hypothetical protein